MIQYHCNEKNNKTEENQPNKTWFSSLMERITFFLYYPVKLCTRTYPKYENELIYL